MKHVIQKKGKNLTGKDKVMCSLLQCYSVRFQNRLYCLNLHLGFHNYCIWSYIYLVDKKKKEGERSTTFHFKINVITCI